MRYSCQRRSYRHLQHAFGNPLLNDKHTWLHWDIFRRKKKHKHKIHVVDGKANKQTEWIRRSNHMVGVNNKLANILMLIYKIVLIVLFNSKTTKTNQFQHLRCFDS